MKLTKEILKKCLPSATDENIDRYIDKLNLAMDKYHIDTHERIAAFIAQIAHESGSFRYVRELATGEAYEGRKDLGNTEPGDGVRFKGRGLIQITGRTNYAAVGKALEYDFITNPEHLELPGPACFSAAWFWDSRKLNQLADKNTEADFLTISKRINGVNRTTGLPNGWDDRLRKWNNCKKILYTALL